MAKKTATAKNYPSIPLQQAKNKSTVKRNLRGREVLDMQKFGNSL